MPPENSFAPSAGVLGVSVKNKQKGWVTNLALAAILFIAAFTHFYRLNHNPIFYDEDVYLQATRRFHDVIAANHFGLLLVRKSFGIANGAGNKPPLLVWLRLPFWRLSGDIVTGSRWLSALCGIGSAWIAFLLGSRLFSTLSGLFAALICATSPWLLLHDRMALHDSAVTLAMTADLLLILIYLDKPTKMRFFAAAVVGSLAVLAKPSALLLAPVPLLDWLLLRKAFRFNKSALGPMSLAAVPVVTWLVLYLLHGGIESNKLQAMHSIRASLGDFDQAVIRYMGWAMIGLTLAGVIFACRMNMRGSLVLIACILGWSVPWIAFSMFAPSRYYCPPVVLAAVLAGAGAAGLLVQFRTQPMLLPIVVALVAWAIGVPTWYSLRMASDLAKVQLTKLDEVQYKTSWAAGFCYRDATDYIDSHVGPAARVGYFVNNYHSEGSGFHRSPRAGGTTLGILPPSDIPSLRGPSPIYLVVDDFYDKQPLDVVNTILRSYPDAEKLVRFTNPGGEFGVTILLLPANTTLPASRPSGSD